MHANPHSYPYAHTFIVIKISLSTQFANITAHIYDCLNFPIYSVCLNIHAQTFHLNIFIHLGFLGDERSNVRPCIQPTSQLHRINRIKRGNGGKNEKKEEVKKKGSEENEKSFGEEKEIGSEEKKRKRKGVHRYAVMMDL